MSEPQEPLAELTTVGADAAVIHRGTEVRRLDGLRPDTDYDLDGFSFRTLPDLGPELSRFTTVNDVHFGEQAAGIISGSDIGPVLHASPRNPYPEFMNRGAAAEMEVSTPDLVVVKGDLTSDGSDQQIDRFHDVYDRFGERLVVVRGNHESYHRVRRHAEPWQQRDLPGVTIVLLDTSIDGGVTGTVTDEQLERLDALGAEADRPVLVFGHHPIGDRESTDKSDRDFGIDPDRSDLLREVVARRPAIVGYSAGHTHRNRVRHFPETGDVPFGEVASVKEYPGVWAEYRVHEGGIVQLVHRISTPEALEWTERTRHMYAGLFADYAFGRLDERCFVIGPRDRRARPGRS